MLEYDPSRLDVVGNKVWDEEGKLSISPVKLDILRYINLQQVENK